jgi:hypothetical protein
MHETDEEHDTSSSVPFGASATYGVGSIDQLLPSHRCTSAWRDAGGDTAVHTLGVGHDTLLKLTAGLGWIDQLVPSQRSSNGRCPSAPKENPVAMHHVGDAHDTPDRPLAASGGAVSAWIDQLLPSQCSASGCGNGKPVEGAGTL